MPTQSANHKPIENQWELEVYQLGKDFALRIYHLSKQFPPEERSSLRACQKTQSFRWLKYC